ncbi:LacI family DNA-binding transcriptional regulator [Ornithinibacillus californiensis]|uniref:LacI family DNA-binding transcriptional regulator n=1 Tax=Ornithinibacillus californiensis TaxID=161536 RepID=UPI00064D9680|nr:LacI family DNA-binding transcriptional regulator [Ornithinibacillus californiensis]
MATIKEIAEMASVSRTTVSRVLNNSGYVSAEARKRVEKVIEETGYEPSIYAKSLRTKRTSVIGVILPTIKTETPSRIVTGLGSELAKHGYQILLANTNLDKEKEYEYLDLLKTRQVDGIVLLATNTDPKLIQKIKEINVPVVIVGQEAKGIMHVTYDDYHAARELTAFLIQKGHTQIAFIGVHEEDRAVGFLRKRGFLDEMTANGLNVELEWIQEGIFDIDSGKESMGKILKQSVNTPTATIAVTDRLAIGAMSYLKDKDIVIPDRMALVGFGASEISQYLEPALTTVDFQNEKAGEQAANQLLAKLNAQTYQEKIILDYRLLIRQSV